MRRWTYIVFANIILLSILLSAGSVNLINAYAEDTSGGYALSEMRDAQGRIKIEVLEDGRYKYYAWESGYDERVGGGYYMLKSGHSYTYSTQNWMQLEVRLISNDELLGYALLIDSGEGAFSGFEKPINYIDNNKDELVSIQELNTALSKLTDDANAVEKSQPTIASGFKNDISSANASINSLDILNAYQTIEKLFSDMESAKDKIAQERIKSIPIYAGISLLALVLIFSTFKIIRTRKKKMSKIPLESKDSKKQTNRLDYDAVEKNDRQAKIDKFQSIPSDILKNELTLGKEKYSDAALSLMEEELKRRDVNISS